MCYYSQIREHRGLAYLGAEALRPQFSLALSPVSIVSLINSVCSKTLFTGLLGIQGIRQKAFMHIEFNGFNLQTLWQSANMI